MQEGRAAGYASKARDRMLVQASSQRLTTFEAYAQMGIGSDARRYGEVASACRLLGVRAPLRLLTNNPDKLAALAGEGIPIAGAETLATPPSPFNGHYLAAKSGAGHVVGGWTRAVPLAEPPEPVQSFTPHPLTAAPRYLKLASYLLPIRTAAAPAWFRLHCYFDIEARAERIVLGHARPDAAGRGPLVRVQHEALLERFPLRSPRLRPRWRAAARRIVEHGSGWALFLAAGDAGEAAEADRAALDLLALHVADREACVLADEPEATPEEAAVAGALARRGVGVGARAVLAAEA
jgi:GTP cyclohydrolase II